MSTTLIRKPCPRCGTTECFGVDDKSCSDCCVTRQQQENAALRAALARVTEERDRLDNLTSRQSGSFTMLHEQIAERDAELLQWRANGVTEELLRRHDGVIKLGNGCSIVRAEDYRDLQQPLAEANKRIAFLDARCAIAYLGG